MKHRLVMLIALLLSVSVLALCAGCSKPAETTENSPAAPPAATAAVPQAEETAPQTEETSPAAGRNAGLDAAFAAGENFRLIPVELPATSPGEGWMAVDLSPDGQTVLWRYRDNKSDALSLARGSDIIPVAFNGSRGVGDPYDNGASVSSGFYRMLPGREGLSWSQDGRLAAVSSYDASTRQVFSDAAVIDAGTGDLYLADTYRTLMRAARDGDRNSPDVGITFLNRIDRSGQYCYYIRLNSEGYALCRCPVEGGAPEVLHLAKDGAYDLVNGSMLWETADGGWLLTGVNGKVSQKNLRFALIRFSPDKDTWRMDAVPLPVIFGKWLAPFASRSAASGYGLIGFRYALAGSASAVAQASQGTDPSHQFEIISSLVNHVELMRLHPGEEPAYDFWFLQKTGGEGPGAELLPADEFLWCFHRKYNEYPMLFELAEMEKRVPADPDAPLPEGYTVEDAVADFRGEKLQSIAFAAVSPDGYYALICAGSGDEWPLYLASLETMQLRPVSAPAGVGGAYLLRPDDFPPMVKWNADGTLLILDMTEEAAATHTYRLVYGAGA